MTGPLDRKLLEQHRFEAVIARLIEKIKSEPSKLFSAPVNSEFTLSWVLASQDLVRNKIFEVVRKGQIELGHAAKTIIVTNKAREIYVNNWLDRILLMITASIVTEETNHLVPDCVYSFRKGRGPLTAIDKLANYVEQHRDQSIYMLKRDISKYGDSIPQDLMLQRLHSDLKFDSNPVLKSLLEQGIRIRVYESEFPEREHCLTLGVPSGSPLVPPLENYYLTPLDHALSQESDCFYGRYGDDFLFATTDSKKAAEIDARIEKVVAELGLHVKASKKVNFTMRAHQTSGIEWLGRHLSATGSVGLKNERSQALRLYLKSEIRDLAKRAQGFFALKSQSRFQMFKNGIHELLLEELHSNTHLREFVFAQSNLPLLAHLDRALHLWVHRELCEQWNLGRREAWRILRKVKIPSLAYSRHRYFKELKKQYQKNNQAGAAHGIIKAAA